MRKLFFTGALLAATSFSLPSLAQNVGINTATPHPSAALDVSATNKGFLPPRMTTPQMNAIAAPASGLMVFNTDTKQLMQWNGSSWQSVTPIATNGLSIRNNAVELGGTLIKNTYILVNGKEFAIATDSTPSAPGLHISSDGKARLPQLARANRTVLLAEPDGTLSSADSLLYPSYNGELGIGKHSIGKAYSTLSLGTPPANSPASRVALYEETNSTKFCGMALISSGGVSGAGFWGSTGSQQPGNGTGGTVLPGLFVTGAGTSGKVGIGTIDPQAALHLANGTMRISSFAGSGTRPVLVDDNGDLSVSTTPDNSNTDELQTLSLSGSTLAISGGNSITLPDVSVTNELQTLSISGNTLSISNGNSVIIPNDNLGNHTATQNIRLNGNYLSNDGDSEGISVSNSGNVGINVANSSYPLHVSGTPYLGYRSAFISGNGAVGTGLTLEATGTGGRTYTLLSSAGGAGIGAGGFGIFDETAAAYRFSINASGNATFNGNVTVNGTLTGMGAVSLCNGAYTCSDRRYKRDIQPLSGALGKVMHLQGVSYYLRTEEFPEKQFSSSQQIGFIAQDLEAVYPEMVYTDPQTGYKSVDYARMTPVLVEALKELKSEVDALSAENAAIEQVTTGYGELKAQVDALNKAVLQYSSK